MQNAVDVFTDLMQREEINPPHPAMTGKRRYEVSAFEMPICQPGAGYIVVKPEGSRGGQMIATCTREVQYFLRVDVVQDSQDQRGFSDFMRTVSRIEGLFRPGSAILFEAVNISTTINNETVTATAPFCLTDLGIYRHEVVSVTQPRRVSSGGCNPWMASMLVALTLHFYAG